MARGLRAAGADVDIAPVADGGEGTLDALVAACGGHVMGVIARGPMGLPVRAHLARLDDGTGVVELAQASGLVLVPEAERDPMRAHTFGTGEMIKGALARRPARVVIALGGSATIDGGIGLARALGVRFLDADGANVGDGGAGMIQVASIDAERLDARWSAVTVDGAADVTTLLADAAPTFGPQKGATPEMIEQLMAGLDRLGTIIERDLGVAVSQLPGGGAAGGCGAMLAGLGARLRPGAEVVFEAIGLTERIRDADLVVTGEGRLDEQTSMGKAPYAVARLAAEAGVPCVALVGEVVDRPEVFAEIRSLLEYMNGDRDEAMTRAAAGLQALGARLASDRRRA